jgi:5-methyltetrahydropteroyltriglutamate--homocysteine methyltransferase
MKTSADHILTTHVGSLPRPPDLEAKLLERERGEIDAEGQALLPKQVAAAVRDVVKRQASIGLSVVDDGEMSKYAYATYARERVTGISGADQPLALSELGEFPIFAKRIVLEIKGAESCVARHPGGSDAHARLLGQLRVAPPSRYRALRDFRLDRNRPPYGPARRSGQPKARA